MSQQELLQGIPNADILIRDWAENVYAHASIIDPESEEHWGSMVLGWALAKGLTPEQARNFANHVRYRTEYN